MCFFNESMIGLTVCYCLRCRQPTQIKEPMEKKHSRIHSSPSSFCITQVRHKLKLRFGSALHLTSSQLDNICFSGIYIADCCD